MFEGALPYKSKEALVLATVFITMSAETPIRLPNPRPLCTAQPRTLASLLATTIETWRTIVV
jgi:hypothetical protein